MKKLVLLTLVSCFSLMSLNAKDFPPVKKSQLKQVEIDYIKQIMGKDMEAAIKLLKEDLKYRKTKGQK